MNSDQDTDSRHSMYYTGDLPATSPIAYQNTQANNQQSFGSYNSAYPIAQSPPGYQIHHDMISPRRVPTMQLPNYRAPQGHMMPFPQEASQEAVANYAEFDLDPFQSARSFAEHRGMVNESRLEVSSESEGHGSAGRSPTPTPKPITIPTSRAMQPNMQAYTQRSAQSTMSNFDELLSTPMRSGHTIPSTSTSSQMQDPVFSPNANINTPGTEYSPQTYRSARPNAVHNGPARSARPPGPWRTEKAIHGIPFPYPRPPHPQRSLTMPAGSGLETQILPPTPQGYPSGMGLPSPVVRTNVSSFDGMSPAIDYSTMPVTAPPGQGMLPSDLHFRWPPECFSCICGATFKDEKKKSAKGNLKRHIEEQTNKKQYACGYCEHQTARKSNLDEHMKNCHGVQIPRSGRRSRNH